MFRARDDLFVEGFLFFSMNSIALVGLSFAKKNHPPVMSGWYLLSWLPVKRTLLTYNHLKLNFCPQQFCDFLHLYFFYTFRYVTLCREPNCIVMSLSLWTRGFSLNLVPVTMTTILRSLQSKALGFVRSTAGWRPAFPEVHGKDSMLMILLHDDAIPKEWWRSKNNDNNKTDRQELTFEGSGNLWDNFFQALWIHDCNY